MAVLHVSIDGETVIDGDIGQWTSEPPKILREQLAATATPQPWMRCLLMVIATAAMTDTATTVTVVTAEDRWTMDVRTP